jgi:hypothetical protein
MKWVSLLGPSLGLFFVSAFASADSFTIEDYNAALPIWGTSWKAGPSAINGYYPSFYTGFAPRSSTPSRIHLRLARGNQTRVSVILDEETVSNYLFDLAKRYRFYAQATAGARPLVNVRPDSAQTERVLPQLSYFNRILESDAYGILSFVSKSAGTSAESVYEKSLQTISALNPNRVFDLRIDLTREYLNWRSQLKRLLAGVADPAAYFTLKSPSTVVALNSLVPGRVNVTTIPSLELLAELATVSRMAMDPATSDDAFVLAANQLFRNVTGKKYDFRVLDRSRNWSPALNCAGAGRCFLSYTEFTTIYPTGSIKEFVVDEHGNSISDFATPGLWKFVSRGSRAVDNIRQEPYYGWAPKMDYEAAGNGFHNPAVRFTSLNRAMKEQLNLPDHHSTFWSVKRGGVSHGCSRLPLGHIWEMRHLFPVADSAMSQVHYFGSDPRDFDVYDVNGDGRAEVMGVEYLISYGLREADGLGSREGTDLEIGRERKHAFYQKLYGERNVFKPTGDGGFLFSSPRISLPSYLDLKSKRIGARVTLEGDFPLYEQEYERDKVQLYLPVTTAGMTDPGPAPLSKRIIRLMGRVRGCAPSADKEACGEAAFDREAAQIFGETSTMGVTP